MTQQSTMKMTNGFGLVILHIRVFFLFNEKLEHVLFPFSTSYIEGRLVQADARLSP